MPTIRVSGLVLAMLGTATLAACNLVLGLGGYTGGTGGATGPSGPSASSTGAMDGGGTGGNEGTGGHDAGPKSTAGQGIWSKSFAGATVNAIAAAPDGTVYLTGNATQPSVFGCTTTSDAGDSVDAGAGLGFLVQLDTSGACAWGLFFDDQSGNTAQGTGVAVDPMTGNVAFTGTFTNKLTLKWLMNVTGSNADSFVALLDSSSDHNALWVAQIDDNFQNGGQEGDQKTTGVAVVGGTVAVSGTYTNSLGVSFQSASFAGIASQGDALDAFVIWFDAAAGTYGGAYRVLSPGSSNADQVATGVALDLGMNVAIAGTTKGSTFFNTMSGTPEVASAGGDIFLTACTQFGSAEDFATIFGGMLVQHGRGVAFDADDGLLLGGDFAGTVVVVDAGTSYTATGTSALVAHYSGTGALLGSLQFGAGTMTDQASLAGVAPFPVLGFDGGVPLPGGSVAFAGGFSGSAPVADGGMALKSKGSSMNVYVAKADGALGGVLWAEQFGDGMGPQSATVLAVNPKDGDIYIAGQYQGTLDFGDAGTFTNNGTPALFIAKLLP